MFLALVLISLTKNRKKKNGTIVEKIFENYFIFRFVLINFVTSYLIFKIFKIFKLI